MISRKLQDRLYLGLGVSARHIGQVADAFRPSGPFRPLATQNRFLRLPAAFTSSYNEVRQTSGYGNTLWLGIYDASYTQAGDYLVTENAIFFVGSQAPLRPVLCVKTNRTISIAKPSMQTGVARNDYGGYTPASLVDMILEWPAAVNSENKIAHASSGLPGDHGAPSWNVLVPAPKGVVLSPGDIITDDLGRTAVIVESELTDLGWRLGATLATT